MNVRRFVLFALLIIWSSVSGFAQSVEQTQGASGYDAELAKKLDADEFGMKHYVLAIIKTGPNDDTIKGKEGENLFAGRMAKIGRLANEGKLAVAGPFGKNDKHFSGLFIFNVTTVEEAQKLTETDPAVKAGIFVVELTPWYGSAALMATPEIHKKIAKSTP